jgi:hypothetical protein
VYKKGTSDSLKKEDAEAVKKEYAELSEEVKEYENAETEYAKASKEKWSNISKGIG